MKSKEEKREYARRWKEANREHVREEMRKWKKTNRDKVNARMRDWYAINADRISKTRTARRPARAQEINARAKQNRINNPEKVAEYQKNYLNTHLEQRKEYERKWHEANRGRRREVARQRRLANPLPSRLKVFKRRALKAGASGVCSEGQATARIAYYSGMCAYCGSAKHAQLDHVIPLSRGGSNWPANLRPSCERCNKSKGSKLLSEWKRRPKRTDAYEASRDRLVKVRGNYLTVFHNGGPSYHVVDGGGEPEAITGQIVSIIEGER